MSEGAATTSAAAAAPTTSPNWSLTLSSCIDEVSLTPSSLPSVRLFQTLLSQWQQREIQADNVKYGMTKEQLQQLLEFLLKLQLTVASMPSSAATQLHAQRILLDKFSNELQQLPPSHLMFDAIAAILSANTPANAGNSRRNSLTDSPSSMRMRNAAGGSASADDAVASVRLNTFRWAFEYIRGHAKKLVGDTNTSDSTKLFLSFSIDMHRQALADVWSAIRKAAASDLSKASRGGIVSLLNEQEIENFFEQLMDAVGLSANAENLSRPNWQRQEGGMLGIVALLQALHHLVGTITEGEGQARKISSLPSFLTRLDYTRFYPLLSHAQLTVREQTTAALQGFVQLLHAGQGHEAAIHTRHEIVHTLMQKLSASMLYDETDGAAENLQFVSDYESEGILTTVHALGLSHSPAYIRTLDHYLAHPASTVRQQVADILSSMALRSENRHSGVASSSELGMETPFALLTELQGGWSWEAQEEKCYANAMREGVTLGEAHPAAVWFSIPPPLLSTAARSRRTSAASITTTTAPPSETSSSVSPPQPLSPLSPSDLKHRSTWQWKEGALMALELYLGGLSKLGPSFRVTSAISASLAALFPQVIRAALSWSWELRRMSEQLRTVFLSTWLQSPTAGLELHKMCETWLTESSHPTASPISSSIANQGLSPLLSASCAALTLHLVISHIHRSLELNSARTPLVATSTKEDPGIDRKWQQESDEMPLVHSHVWNDLCQLTPGILHRLEQQVITAEVLEHAAVSRVHALDLSISTPAPQNIHTPSLLSWDQFISLALQSLVSSYAVLTATPASVKVIPAERMRSVESSQLQHYQCVLDRLRTLRCLSVGDGVLPAPSVPAQMLSPATTPSSSIAVTALHAAVVTNGPPSPARAPRSPGLNPAMNAIHLLPTLSPIIATASTLSFPSSGLALQPQSITRSRAKRLESWILTHIAPFLSAFVSIVPRVAHIDLMDLLLDYITRFHNVSADLRSSLLSSISVGWHRTQVLIVPSVSLWSHQLHNLQDDSITLLLQLLAEHVNDRTKIVKALSTIIVHTPLNNIKLQTILHTLSDLIADEDISLEMNSPPSPPPPSVLSPTSAEQAAATEAWDDWDADEEGDGAGASTAEGVSEDDKQVTAERFNAAKSLVSDISPLLFLLAAQTYTSVLGPSKPASTSSSATIARIPAGKEHADHKLSPAPPAHCQSSLMDLVRAYDYESNSASGFTDRQRQIELLGWIQTWVKQVQQRMLSEDQKAHAHSTAPSTTSAQPVPLLPVAVLTPPSHYSAHHAMPNNALFDSTWQSLSSATQKKLDWLQRQATTLGINGNTAAV